MIILNKHNRTLSGTSQKHFHRKKKATNSGTVQKEAENQQVKSAIRQGSTIRAEDFHFRTLGLLLWPPNAAISYGESHNVALHTKS
jgi:hypothetical protein